MRFDSYQSAGYKEACERYGLQKEALAPLLVGAGALAARALPALLALGRGAATVGSAAGRAGALAGRAGSAIGRGAKTVGSKIWNTGLNVPSSVRGAKYLNMVNPISSKGGLLATVGFGAAERAMAKQKAKDVASGFKRNFDSAIGPDGQPLIVKRDKPQYIV
jgi:hypothetical protein